MNKDKATLFGSVTRIESTKKHTPHLAKLKEAKVHGGHIAIFCTGCGITRGTSKDGLEKLSEIENFDIPKSILGKYLVFDSCPTCNKGFSNHQFKSNPKS